MKIISYNINGIRAGVRKGLVDWLKSNDFDIVCFQEIKAMEVQIPVSLFEEIGYHHYWFSAEKKGYSGVGVLSKVKPKHVEFGCGIQASDFEGRTIRVDYENFSVLNCYFPSGTSGDVRQKVKYQFLDDIYDYVNELRKTHPNLIVLGDYNIAHTENDIHNPKSNKKTSGFLPEEREWMTKWLANGFTDAYRHLNPEKIEYSWWSLRANSRANNKGWRIDYQSVSDPLKDKLIAASHYKDAVHSDHCPVFIEIDL